MGNAPPQSSTPHVDALLTCATNDADFYLVHGGLGHAYIETT